VRVLVRQLVDGDRSAGLDLVENPRAVFGAGLFRKKRTEDGGMKEERS